MDTPEKSTPEKHLREKITDFVRENGLTEVQHEELESFVACEISKAFSLGTEIGVEIARMVYGLKE